MQLAPPYLLMTRWPEWHLRLSPRVIVSMLIASFALAAPLRAAPAASLWAFWLASDETSSIVVDHSEWDAFLERFIRHDGTLNRVNYTQARPHRDQLSDYVNRLVQIAPRSLRKKEQMPYWINLYNAYTLLLVLEHEPVRSIRDIRPSGGLFVKGPWRHKGLTIEGKEVSLDDIEHRILRPIFQDARVHYAVNCASVGCPNLQKSAFTSQRMEAQLEKAARDFVNSDRGVLIENHRVVISSIYHWFEADFIAADGGVREHLLRYLEPADKKNRIARASLNHHRYDWNLNDAPW